MHQLPHPLGAGQIGGGARPDRAAWRRWADDRPPAQRRRPRAPPGPHGRRPAAGHSGSPCDPRSCPGRAARFAGVDRHPYLELRTSSASARFTSTATTTASDARRTRRRRCRPRLVRLVALHYEWRSLRRSVVVPRDHGPRRVRRLCEYRVDSSMSVRRNVTVPVGTISGVASATGTSTINGSPGRGRVSHPHNMRPTGPNIHRWMDTSTAAGSRSPSPNRAMFARPPALKLGTNPLDRISPSRARDQIGAHHVRDEGDEHVRDDDNEGIHPLCRLLARRSKSRLPCSTDPPSTSRSFSPTSPTSRPTMPHASTKRNGILDEEDNRTVHCTGLRCVILRQRRRHGPSHSVDRVRAGHHPDAARHDSRTRPRTVTGSALDRPRRGLLERRLRLRRRVDPGRSACRPDRQGGRGVRCGHDDDRRRYGRGDR